MKRFYWFLLAIPLVVTLGCEETEFIDFDYKYDYFPLEVGKYIIYDVDSVTYDFSNVTTSYFADTVYFQIREIVTDSFIDNENRTAYTIERQRRNEPTQPWEVEEVMYAVKNHLTLELVENNRRFIKMIYPPKVNQAWDGNSFFDVTENIVVAGETVEMFKNWEYTVKSVDSTETIGNFNFDQVLTVQLADDKNAIELRFAQEKYARGVGLVEKTYRILDTQCIAECAGQTWEEKAEKGFILTTRVVDYN